MPCSLWRADRAEEIAELKQREAEMQRREAGRQQYLDAGVQHLSQVLVQAAKGDRTVRTQMALTQKNGKAHGCVVQGKVTTIAITIQRSPGL